MAKQPSFQFYPGDWMKDADLSVCSTFARGLLLDLLCVCFDSKHRGLFVRHDGVTPWTDTQIVDSVRGSNRSEKLAALKELEDNCVLKRNDKGILYSARMMRDEDIRQMRAQSGSDGGNKKVANHVAKGVAEHLAITYQKATPSSSSSSSSSERLSSKEESQGIDKLITEKQPRKKTAEITIPENLSAHPDFASAWAEWEHDRKERKKPLTNAARTKQLAMLAEHGPVKAIAMLTASITNGWAGLFPVDDKRIGRNGSTQPDCLDAANYVGAPCMSEEEAGVPF